MHGVEKKCIQGFDGRARKEYPDVVGRIILNWI
jgi:hypothetical protein